MKPPVELNRLWKSVTTGFAWSDRFFPFFFHHTKEERMEKTAWPWDYGRFEAEKFCRFHRWPFNYETFPLKLSMDNTCRRFVAKGFTTKLFLRIRNIPQPSSYIANLRNFSHSKLFDTRPMIPRVHQLALSWWRTINMNGLEHLYQFSGLTRAYNHTSILTDNWQTESHQEQNHALLS